MQVFNITAYSLQAEELAVRNRGFPHPRIRRGEVEVGVAIGMLEVEMEICLKRQLLSRLRPDVLKL